MTPERLEQLLYESESETLDFKEGQYRFTNATDDEKSELLKDILGFANAWRRSEAYILVGVKEVEGGKSIVVDTDTHLQDHSLQQFVNSKTNRPIRFSYEAVTVEDKSVGIITIHQQPRPFWLTRDYGRLKRDQVYVRRGSSIDITRPASPDEIIKMEHAGTQQAASVEVQLYDPTNRRLLGKTVQMEGRYVRFPSSDDLPDLSSPRVPIGHIAIIGDVMRERNPDYYRQVAAYCHRHTNFQPMQLAIVNTGQVSGEDVRLELDLPPGPGLEVLEQWDVDEAFPQKDYDRIHAFTRAAFSQKVQPFQRRDGNIVIARNQNPPALEVEYRKVQPGRQVLTDTFHIACCQSSTCTLAGKVFSKNLPEPVKVELSIEFDVTVEEVDVERFLQWANNPKSEEEE